MGLSGFQCHGLVGPKIATVGVPMRGRDVHQPELFGHRGVGGGHRQDGIAQIAAGQIAHLGAAGRADLLGNRRLARSAEHPDRGAVGVSARASSA